MTPSAFDYVRPKTLSEAVAALASHGDGAKLMSGGHSLLPMMKLRMAAPAVLIDINELPELHGVTLGPGEVVIGAATTHAALEHHEALAAAVPLIPKVAHQIADATVRNRGTIGGSLAHADPSADWPGAMLALDAVIHLAGARGTRAVAAGDFFIGLFETALRPDEIITAIHVPVAAGTRAVYRKCRHPASGYAVAGVAVDLVVDRGACTGGRIAVNGVATHAFRATQAEALLAGYRGEDAQTERVLDAAFDGVPLLEDRYADAAYRLQLARTMLRRALAEAFGMTRPAA